MRIVVMPNHQKRIQLNLNMMTNVAHNYKKKLTNFQHLTLSLQMSLNAYEKQHKENKINVHKT